MNENLLNIADMIACDLQNGKNIGLVGGKLGLVLFYYKLSKRTYIKTYNDMADNLLDEVLNEVRKVKSNGIEQGLAGIGWGINYLFRNEFVEVDEDAFIDVELRLFSGSSVDFGTNLSTLSLALYLLSKPIRKDMFTDYENQIFALLNTCRYYCLSIYDNKKKPLDLINSMLYFLLELKKQNIYLWESNKLIWKILTYLLDYKDIENDQSGDTVILLNLLNQIDDSTPLKKDVIARLNNLKKRDWSIEAYKKILWQLILFSLWDDTVLPDINKLLNRINDRTQDTRGIWVPLGIYLMNMNKLK